MGEWHFVWPWVWWALPLPLLIWWLLPAKQPTQSLALPYEQLNLPSTSRGTNKLTLLLLAVVWLALLLAASRPQRPGPPIVQEQTGRSMLLAVDLSGSMGIEDMDLGGHAVNRFIAVKAIANDFIERRQGDYLGLILFGSNAYLVTPLTYDLSAVSAQLNSSAIGIAGEQTAIGDAIAIATKHLVKRPQDERVLILLTDGVNNSGSVSPEQAAEAAKKAGLRIYTIGVGANKMQVPGFFGTRTVNPSADLDEPLLTRMAEETGGKYFRATDTKSLANAYHTIDQLEPTVQEGKPLHLPIEGYQTPLLFAFGLLLLILFAQGMGRRLIK